MPGLIPHLIAGTTLYLIGRYSFKAYFRGDQKHKKELLLGAVCLTFSLFPDFFIGISYLTHLEPASVMMPFQIFTHHIITPIAIGVLLLVFLFDTKRRPLWIMGASALVLHIMMDLLIMETSYLF